MKFLALFLLLSASPWSTYAKVKPHPKPDWKYVERQLISHGFKSAFIQEVKKTYDSKHFLQVIELNVLLFLRKSDYHGTQVSKQAIGAVRTFTLANQSALRSAEHKYGVSSAVVASLLYLESRYGLNKGRIHVPSVYLHLLQGPRSEMVKHLQKQARRFATKVTAEDRKKINERSVSKAQWALQELKALETIHKKYPNFISKLKGSFSGAFGMPQFIPSSYLRWAKPAVAGETPNLITAADAIHSVAFYLSDNGWKPKRPQTHVPALMHYNNSKDYAMAILELAKQIEFEDKRLQK